MRRLSEVYNAKPFTARYDTLPGRIMLDANVVSICSTLVSSYLRGTLRAMTDSLPLEGM
jgi:hypothetical protein